VAEPFEAVRPVNTATPFRGAVAMSEHHPTASTSSVKPAKPSKPSKPYPDYPLTAHPAGCWCKKIRGKIYYFGPWSDPDAALQKYLEQKDDLHAGKTPRADPEALTVKDVANAYLNAKNEAVDAGELSARTFADYKQIMDSLVAGFGKHKLVATLDPQDFAALKNKLARKNGPPRMSTVVQVIRCAFKFAYDSGIIDKPMRFGPAFKRTSKKTLRLHRARQGAKLFTAEEIRRLLDAAGIPLKAMLLLAINAGFGNADCGRLPLSAVDLERGWIDFPRPKTGLPRRACLWPETVQALKDALAARPEPKKAEYAELVFLTRIGQPWDKGTSANPVSEETKKLLNRLGVNGRKGLGFYTLRHVFRTVADEARDQPAADFIMGHEVSHMSSVYRERISEARLKAVADHVRGWLFGSRD
jgi:integrase